MNAVGAVQSVASLSLTSAQYIAQHYSELQYTSSIVRKHVDIAYDYLNDLTQCCIDTEKDQRARRLVETIETLLAWCQKYERKWKIKRFLFSTSYQTDLDRLSTFAYQQYITWMMSNYILKTNVFATPLV